MQPNNTQANDPSALRDNRAAPPAAPNNAARVPSFAEPYTNPPAEDDTPSADETLAQAMGRLSVQQKRMVEQEIMGKLGVPPENPQHMILLLQQLRARLQSIRHKPAFDLAMRQNPAFVDSPQFLGMFLRAEKHDVNHAADRLVRHFEAKREIWGDAKLAKRITMDDFTAEEKQFFTENGGSIQMLPIRDDAGRAVFFSHEGELANSLMDQNPEIHNIRFLWYLIMAHIEDNDETQINGIVYVGYGVDSKPKRTRDERDVWWATCKALNAMPIRITAFHCCYQGLLMKLLVSLVARGLSPSTRCRIQPIWGNHATCVGHLKTFGIPVHVLPLDEDYAGSFKQKGQSKKKYLPLLLNRREFEKFLRRRKQVEGHPMEYAHRIELLRQTDVIVGKGQNHQRHHANLQFGRLVTESVTRLGAGRSNKERGDIGMKVAIQVRQNGIRFVEPVEKCGIWRLANWQAVKNKVGKLVDPTSIEANNEGEGDDSSTSVASKRARSMPPHSGSPPTADNPETAAMAVANEDEDEDEGDEGRAATMSSHQRSTGSDQDAKPAAKRRATPASAPATITTPPVVSSSAMQAAAVDDDEVQVVQATRAPTPMQLTTSAAGAISPQAQTPTPYGAVPSPNFPPYPAHPRAPTFAAYQQASIQGRGVQMGQVGMPAGITPNAPQLPQNLQAQQARPNLQAFGQPQQLLAGPASGLPNFTMPQNLGFQGTGAVPFQTSVAGANMVGGMTVPTNLYAASAAQPNLTAAVAPNTVTMPTNAGTFPNLMTGGVGGATAFNQGTPNMQLPRNLTPNITQNFTQNMQVPMTSAQAQTLTMVAEQMGRRMGRQLALEMAMERGVRMGFNQAMAQGTMPNANMANASTMHTPTMPPQGMMPAPNANTNATPNSQLPQQQLPMVGMVGTPSDSSTTHALQPASTASDQSITPDSQVSATAVAIPPTPPEGTPAAANQPKTAAPTAPEPPAVAPSEDTPEKITERETDILFGRSRTFHKHLGNIYMHSLVNERKHLFEKAARTERRQFIADVVDELVAEGRRFLTRQTKDADGTWIWVEVSKERAAEKLGHAFRDKRKVVEKKKGGKAMKAGEEDSQAGASSSGKQISEEAAAVEGLVNLRMK